MQEGQGQVSGQGQVVAPRQEGGRGGGGGGGPEGPAPPPPLHNPGLSMMKQATPGRVGLGKDPRIELV